MGLRPLDPAAWTITPADLAAELDRKARLRAERPSEVFAAPDGCDAPAAELLERLLEHLATDRAGAYTRTDHGIAVDGREVTLDGHPLDVAGRLVAEDWCLVRPGPPPVLAAATLCSPNRWRLADKLGRTITSVHAPVPGYSDRLATSVDRLLSRTGPGRAVWRTNWSILDCPDLFQPTRPPGSPVPSVPEGLWVRSERQTLMPLPRSGWWVFGILTRQRPLSDVAARPETARRVRSVLAALDDETAAAKELTPFRERLLAWLEAVTP